MRKNQRAAGFLIFRNVCNRIEYLLLQASNGKHHWTPPKGHVDPGESDLVTAYRETEEESGLKKEHLKVFEGFSKTLKYQAWGCPKEVVYWPAQLKSGDIPVKLSHEHQDYKWAELEKACDLAQYPEMKQLLQDCDNFLKSQNIE